MMKPKPTLVKVVHEPYWVDGTWNDDDGDGILEEDEFWYYDTQGNLIGDLNDNGVEDKEASSFVSNH